MTNQTKTFLVAVACINASGVADMPVFEVCLPQREYELGNHYELAEKIAEEEGYEGPFVCFDAEEIGALKTALEKFSTTKRDEVSLTSMVSEDSDQPGKWYFVLDGEASDISYPSAIEARSALLTAMNPIFDDDEVVVRLECGASLRSGVLNPQDENALTSGGYVRLCDNSGTELLYWSKDEWTDEPDLVMGAIINASSKLSSTTF